MKILVMNPTSSQGERVAQKIDVPTDTVVFFVKPDGTVLYVDTAAGVMWQANTPDDIAKNLCQGHQDIVNAALKEDAFADVETFGDAWPVFKDGQRHHVSLGKDLLLIDGEPQ